MKPLEQGDKKYIKRVKVTCDLCGEDIEVYQETLIDLMWLAGKGHALYRLCHCQLPGGIK